MDEVAEIKDRLGVDEVVGEYVQLKPAGSNFKGLCPFHNEKTPSFMVSPDKGIYHCFGCGEGGDIFTFVEKVDGLTFREALEKLASKAGVELAERSGANTQAAKDHKARLYSVLETAAQYYHIQLSRSSVAREYVTERRSLSEATIKQFRLGWAPPEGSRLTHFLTKQGFTDKELLEAGLARRRGSQLQDLFWGRIMVPFFDVQGRIIGFTGRVLGEGMPKYLNTPQTQLFDKSRFVFGLYQAKESIRTQDESVVVEGNLDVLSSHQAGVARVVAVSGTAVTLPQLKQLARLSDKVTFAFDADSAGIKACMRAVPLAQEVGINLSVVTLPAGSDPDDVIRANPKQWQQLLSDKQYVMDWLIEALAVDYDLATAEGKRDFTSSIADSLRRLRDPVEQEHYIKLLADMTAVAPATVKDKLSQVSPGGSATLKRVKAVSTATPTHDEVTTVSTALLSLAVTYPDVRGALKEVKPEQLDDFAIQLLAYLREHGEDITDSAIPEELLPLENYVKILLLRGEEEYGSWALLDRQVEAFSLTHRLQELQTKRHRQRISQEIAAAEAAGDDDLRRKLLKQYQSLT
ncbi:MAG: DNA primase [Candidatus Saccharimonadales bacterium]